MRSLDCRPLLLAAIAICAVKLVWLAVDPTPLFYMGDSQTYIQSAVQGWVPLTRSYTYGRLIWLIAVLPATLTSLVVAQTSRAL